MRGELWTDERVAQLAELAKMGLSAAAIGRCMGATRNAIIGKIKRLRDVSLLLKPGNQAAHRQAGLTAPEPVVAKPAPAPKVPPPCVDEPPPSDEPQEPKGCRFIYGDVGEEGWRFCQREQALHKAGVHKGSKSRWCAGHYAVVYTGIPKSRVPAPMPGRLPLRVLDVMTAFDE